MSKQDAPPSPADSDIIIHFDDIHNPCCVKSCDIAARVKDFIAESVTSKKVRDEDPCYCDCVCSFKFSNKTTYCAVCGGYECLGDDMKDEPEFAKPHPCPVYHKLYDKKYIQTPNPWPEEDEKRHQGDNVSVKSSRTVGSKVGSPNIKRLPSSRSIKSFTSEKKEPTEVKTKKVKQEKKKIGKFTATAIEECAYLND
jgi:hypothetical protein